MDEKQQILELWEKANRLFKAADHIAYVTYPLVQDNKLIITVTENLSEALVKAMEAVLFYDRYYKRIAPFPENFDSRFQIFRNKLVQRYNFDRNHLTIILNLRQLVRERKQAPMEFIRQDKYVIANQDYSKMKVITMEKLKSYINEGKHFMTKVNLILKNVTGVRSP